MNSPVNAILERVHQIIGNTLRTSKVQNMVLDDKNPLDGISVSTMFALWATVHTTTKYIPAQLIFGRDSIINRLHDVDLETIKKRKQDVIKKGNECENYNRKNHTYKQ